MMGMNVRRFQQPTPDFMPSLAKSRGRGRIVGEPLKKFDQPSFIVIVAMTLVPFVMFGAVSGRWALVWLVAGPLFAVLALTIGRMGGILWARLTAAAYTGGLLVGLGLLLAAA